MLYETHMLPDPVPNSIISRRCVYGHACAVGATLPVQIPNEGQEDVHT